MNEKNKLDFKFVITKKKIFLIVLALLLVVLVIMFCFPEKKEDDENSALLSDETTEMSPMYPRHDETSSLLLVKPIAVMDGLYSDHVLSSRSGCCVVITAEVVENFYNSNLIGEVINIGIQEDFEQIDPEAVAKMFGSFDSFVVYVHGDPTSLNKEQVDSEYINECYVVKAWHRKVIPFVNQTVDFQEVNRLLSRNEYYSSEFDEIMGRKVSIKQGDSMEDTIETIHYLIENDIWGEER